MNKKQEYKDFVTELAKLFRPNVYVEIGARFGYTFNSAAPFCGKAIAVDPVSCVTLSDNVEQYKITSTAFIAVAENAGLKIDMLFIDGDHSSKQVMNDFIEIGKFVVPETGLILLHDTFPVNSDLLSNTRCGDAWKVAREIRSFFPSFEIVTLPGPWAGLSIIRKLDPLKLNRHGWMESAKSGEI